MGVLDVAQVAEVKRAAGELPALGAVGGHADHCVPRLGAQPAGGQGQEPDVALPLQRGRGLLCGPFHLHGVCRHHPLQSLACLLLRWALLFFCCAMRSLHSATLREPRWPLASNSLCSLSFPAVLNDTPELRMLWRCIDKGMLPAAPLQEGLLESGVPAHRLSGGLTAICVHPPRHRQAHAAVLWPGACHGGRCIRRATSHDTNPGETRPQPLPAIICGAPAARRLILVCTYPGYSMGDAMMTSMISADKVLHP